MVLLWVTHYLSWTVAYAAGINKNDRPARPPPFGACVHEVVPSACKPVDEIYHSRLESSAHES